MIGRITAVQVFMEWESQKLKDDATVLYVLGSRIFIDSIFVLPLPHTL